MLWALQVRKRSTLLFVPYIRKILQYLACDKRCSCLLCTLHVTKGAAVCCVPYMWQKMQLSVMYLSRHKSCSFLLCTLHGTLGAAVCCVPCMGQKVQLSFVYLSCLKRCWCLLCTLHVTNGAVLSVVYLACDKRCSFVCRIPCMWQKMQLSAVNLACYKRWSCLLCTFHFRKSCLCLFMWQKMHLSDLYLAGEKVSVVDCKPPRWETSSCSCLPCWWERSRCRDVRWPAKRRCRRKVTRSTSFWGWTLPAQPVVCSVLKTLTIAHQQNVAFLKAGHNRRLIGKSINVFYRSTFENRFSSWCLPVLTTP